MQRGGSQLGGSLMRDQGLHEGAERYLDLLMKTLIRWGEDEFVPLGKGGSLAGRALQAVARSRGKDLFVRVPFDRSSREHGRDWPAHALSMMGLKRMQNLRDCIRSVVLDGVPGDVIETGVWRGGGSIFMCAALEAYGDKEKTVWCADSFQGLPAPDLENYPQDEGVTWHLAPELAVSVEQVKNNFARHGVLNDRVKFLVGWFKDTLPTAPIDRISVLRLDGDMYESTMDALNALYAKLSPGGFAIVDDYGLPEDTCRKAIHDFRDRHGIADPIIDIDGYGAYWRRSH